MARPDQLMPPLEDPWRVTYWQGGRGSGKTRTCAQALAELVQGDTDGEGEYGIIGPTYADAWTKCVEGESGILRAMGTNMAQIKDHRSTVVRSAWRTYGQVVLHNGIIIYIDSAAEGGLRIQGRNLKGIWCDEIGLWEKWETAWNESIRYAVRHGHSKILCDGTPKASRPARKLVRSLIRNEPEHGGVIVRRLRTVDNKDNLSPAFYRAVIGAAKGTRLERQELDGELLDDVANALWTRDLLEGIYCGRVGDKKSDGPPHLRKVFVGVDPSDGSEESDEQAYTVSGLGPGDDPHVYVAENWGGQEAPAPFAKRVILVAYRWNGTIVVEKNHGGEWLRTVFAQVMKELIREGRVAADRQPRVRLIWASKSKRTRAEPVSSLYERLNGTLVRHAGGPFVDLEDQMATFTGASDERSPDRLDSLVWSLTPFLTMGLGIIQDGGVSHHQWAGQQELARTGLTGAQILTQRRLATAHGGAYAKGDDWDLDSFAPQADEGRDTDRHGPRGNRHEWR